MIKNTKSLAKNEEKPGPKKLTDCLRPLLIHNGSVKEKRKVNLAIN